MKPVTILIIGSDSERRQQLKQWVKQTKGASLLGEISEMNGLRLVPRLAPDVVIYDCDSPALNPLAILPWLQEQPYPPLTLALLTGAGEREKQWLLALGATECAASLSAGDFPARLSALVQQAGERSRDLPEPGWADLLG